jgi:hypothetical protein
MAGLAVEDPAGVALGVVEPSERLSSRCGALHHRGSGTKRDSSEHCEI